MEEVDDIIPEEEVEELPEPPPLKRANKLTEKVTCEGCGKIYHFMLGSTPTNVKLARRNPSKRKK